MTNRRETNMNGDDPIRAVRAEYATPDADVDAEGSCRHIDAMQFLADRFGVTQPSEQIYAASLGNGPTGVSGDAALESRLELGAALDALARFDLAPDADEQD